MLGCKAIKQEDNPRNAICIGKEIVFMFVSDEDAKTKWLIADTVNG